MCVGLCVLGQRAPSLTGSWYSLYRASKAFLISGFMVRMVLAGSLRAAASSGDRVCVCVQIQVQRMGRSVDGAEGEML